MVRDRAAGRMMQDPERRRAFGEQVEVQLDALYRAALRLTRNASDAEDLVSESVAKAWYRLDSLDDWNAFRGWLFRIMRNHFITGYRRRMRAPAVVASEGSLEQADQPDLASLLAQQSDDFLQWWANPEKELANRLLGDDIMEALTRLPDAFRDVILLICVDGLGYDEAAAVLGVPTGTVRSRMKRGRTQLQQALWQHARDAGLVRDMEATR